MTDHPAIEFIQNEDHYARVVEEGVLAARRSLHIATANLKNLHVIRGRKSRSIVDIFADLVDRGVAIRVLHGARPSSPFAESLASHSTLARDERFEMLFCPRTHFKMILVDDSLLYAGSANLTGAGLGAKSPARRNFETGFLTTDPEMIAPYRDLFTRIWSGEFCEECGRREHCE
ncbi:MAG: phospholipase D family protein [Candidatus Eisenbacteria bacterium]|nr:phospholipase D family protein [Candidatus Eisenbacteria bacterium]